jgi:hypothetical protein
VYAQIAESMQVRTPDVNFYFCQASKEEKEGVQAEAYLEP